MDPVTQAALGAAVGGLFRPKLGGKAIVVGAACGFAPDLDVVAGYAGEFATLVHHRGLTHSLPVLAVVSPAVGWIARRWSGVGSLAAWTHLAFWSLVTHPLLDWCTTYGTQLLLPFTDRRFAVDAVAVIDPLGTLPLLVAVAVHLRRSADPKRQAVWSAAMLAVFVAYLGVGYAQSRVAASLAARQLGREGVEVSVIRAPPTMFNLFLRRVVARTDDGRLLVGHVSTLAPRRIEFAEAAALDGPLREAVLESYEGRVFVWFADGLLSVGTMPTGGGTAVTLSDQRYGLISRPLDSPFRATAVIPPDGPPGRWRRIPRAAVSDLAGELRVLWRGITTGEIPSPVEPDQTATAEAGR